ncbi:hypothetical protein C8J27_10759 [Rhodobacter aestuarii]|uniref:Uncharacterized protein n=1 Tax=Rhodobacter aestuarii TaxID=453582 RepID=A0A1N7NVH5_9RHOB|nr:hypothetical protein [Rhodobacter aestuarii]PTV94528.1 hypothetical protein C8J27_10759 [Rhodobacter aestuarii]SIT02292.1 hypothetical protein SAMN05421580_108168 [Rhodobacter aestuarii]
MPRKYFQKSLASLALACAALAAPQAMALSGGVYNQCNGIEWHSSPSGPQGYGKTCIHCNAGNEVRFWSEYQHNSAGQYTGKMNYYDLNGHYICTGSRVDCVIRYYCGG